MKEKVNVSNTKFELRQIVEHSYLANLNEYFSIKIKNVKIALSESEGDSKVQGRNYNIIVKDTLDISSKVSNLKSLSKICSRSDSSPPFEGLLTF